MARITSYANDGSLDGADKVIGTDALDGSTKNFSLGSLATFVESETAYTAGTGIDVTNRVISADLVAGTGINISGNTIACTVTDTDTTYTAGDGIAISGANVISSTVDRKEEFIGRNDADINVLPAGDAVTFSSAGSNAETDSLVYNPSALTITSNAIQNTSGAAINLKVAMSAFVNAGANNVSITYALQKSTDGATWTTTKEATRSKSASGAHADSFFGYFNLPAGHYMRIFVSSTTSNIVLEEGSIFEFIVKE